MSIETQFEHFFFVAKDDIRELFFDVPLGILVIQDVVQYFFEDCKWAFEYNVTELGTSEDSFFHLF